MHEIATVGRAILFRLGIVSFATLGVLAVTSAPALATHLGDPEGISLSAGRIAYVAGVGQTNNVTVQLSGASYTITDTGVATIPDGDGAGGCSVSGQTATCPSAGIVQVFIEVLDGDDNVDGGPGDDVILGGDGGDTIDAHEGNDVVDTGPGQPGVPPEEQTAFDFANGGTGYNTITFASRTESLREGGLGIMIDNRPDRDFAIDTDGTFESMDAMQVLIGSKFDDEIVGSYQSETLIGGPGADTLCGGLGVDAVDYSNSPGPVHVTLDGDMPTDQDLGIQLTPEPGQSSEEARARFFRARHDCRQTNPANGLPIPGDRDCTADDGAWNTATGTTAEGDCVGEDVEDIIGSSGDDVLVGNDPDPLEGRGPRVEPHGANRIVGGGGNDLMDGRGGPDVYEGGGDIDTVTYFGGAPPSPAHSFGPRTTAVDATIDGVANDGGPEDANRAALRDSIGTGVERILGGVAGDTLRGSPNSDILEGGPGNDFIDGGGGSDKLDGGTNDDVVAGGTGDDDIHGGTGDDTLEGDAGTDGINGDDGSDAVRGGNGADVMSGGAGTDTLNYSDATTPVTVTPDGAANDGTAGDRDNVAADFEMVFGGIGNDTLVGTDNPDLLDGGGGDDTLDGAGASDELIGGTGMDLASYASRTGPVFVDLAAPGGDGEANENDNINGDVEKVAGGSADDTIRGNGLGNVLNGGPGNDNLAGAEGDDLLNGSFGNDSLSGDVGSDALFGSEGNDSLFGGDGGDELKGEAGDDSLDGGAGADRLIGGPGLDRALYSGRAVGVSLTLQGKDKNGERNENDFINNDVENATTGRGGDTIDSHDHKQGDVRCGAGTDVVTADPEDRVASDCESVQVSAFGTRCTASHSKVTLSGSAIPVKVFCAVGAKGTLRLESASRVRSGKSRKVLKIGSKSFTLKAGQRKTIKVKASKAALRLIKRKKRLSVRARVAAKASGKAKASSLKATTVLTVRAKR